MDGKTLAFYQIFYKDEHLKELYPFAIPYDNRGKNPAPYFENGIIKTLVPQCDADYISVCSWRLRRKRGDGVSQIILKNRLELSEEKILSSDFDIAVLTPRNHKDIVEKLVMWHGNPAVEALAEFNRFIKIHHTVDHAIYENHFIARKEIYQSYVKDCLAPAIAFMDERPVFMRDSGYKEKKKRDQEGLKEAQGAMGRDDYPIAPFILERLFSVYITGKGYKTINL